MIHGTYLVFLFKVLGLRGEMAAELVNATTSENLKEMDWTKSIEICELVARDQGYTTILTE